MMIHPRDEQDIYLETNVREVSLKYLSLFYVYNMYVCTQVCMCVYICIYSVACRPAAGASRRFEVMSAFALRNGARDRGVVTWNFDPGIERIKSTRSYRNAEKQLLSLSSETLMQPVHLHLFIFTHTYITKFILFHSLDFYSLS